LSEEVSTFVVEGVVEVPVEPVAEEGRVVRDRPRSLRSLFVEFGPSADSRSSTLLEAGSRASGTSIAERLCSGVVSSPLGRESVSEHLGQLENCTMQWRQMYAPQVWT